MLYFAITWTVSESFRYRFFQVFQTPVRVFLPTTGSHGPSHPPKKNPEVFVEKMMQSELENSDFFQKSKDGRKTRWWQLKYFLFSPLPGEMIQID